LLGVAELLGDTDAVALLLPDGLGASPPALDAAGSLAVFSVSATLTLVGRAAPPPPPAESSVRLAAALGIAGAAAALGAAVSASWVVVRRRKRVGAVAAGDFRAAARSRATSISDLSERLLAVTGLSGVGPSALDPLTIASAPPAARRRDAARDDDGDPLYTAASFTLDAVRGVDDGGGGEHFPELAEGSIVDGDDDYANIN
jgi:hypothetical protein